MDKVKRTRSSPYVSPYLRRPLRTLSDALSEREADDGYHGQDRHLAGEGGNGRAPQTEGKSA